MSNKRVVLVGAGYTLQRVGQIALTNGHEVLATNRSTSGGEAMRALGAITGVWDGGPFPFRDALEDALVFYSVPPRDADDPLQSLLDMATNAFRFTYLSSTSVYGDGGGDTWIDETSPCQPVSPVGRGRLAAEQRVLASGLEACVVRIAGIYGPGRTLLDYMASGRYKLVNPDKRTNRIHVDDLAQILWAAGRQTKTSDVFNAADGAPQKVGALVDFLVEHYGAAQPERMTLQEYEALRGPNAAGRWKTSTQIRADRVRTELGVQLKYKDVFEGYRAILDQK